MIGYAMCGSFCTHARALAALRELIAAGEQVQPILSEVAYATDTRFGRASTLVDTLETLCGRSVIHTVEGAEPLGPSRPLEVLIIAPCTGNTLAKMAMGITDGAVTMAAKAHLRCPQTLEILVVCWGGGACTSCRFCRMTLSASLTRWWRILSAFPKHWPPRAKGSSFAPCSCHRGADFCVYRPVLTKNSYNSP